jgi:DNA-binding CsgD family transcriptional regulator
MVGYYRQGIREKEIASLTGVSKKTVHAHLHGACVKLGLENTRQLLQLAARDGRNDGGGHSR